MSDDLFGGLPATLDEQIAELERELRQRERVYPRLIANGTLRRDRAERQTAAMEAAVRTLRGLRA